MAAVGGAQEIKTVLIEDDTRILPNRTNHFADTLPSKRLKIERDGKLKDWVLNLIEVRLFDARWVNSGDAEGDEAPCFL
ncbi:hypothetical protein D3C87_1978860 [compost metagenome]